MDVYQIWCDLKPGVSDVTFADHLGRYLSLLQRDGRIVSWRLLRRKLGLGPDGLGEFQVLIETRDLAQLDAAFQAASRRSGEVDEAHAGVNQLVTGFRAGLWRDFPDAHRARGDERF